MRQRIHLTLIAGLIMVCSSLPTKPSSLRYVDETEYGGDLGFFQFQKSLLSLIQADAVGFTILSLKYLQQYLTCYR